MSPSRIRQPQRPYELMDDMSLFSYVFSKSGKIHHKQDGVSMSDGSKVHRTREMMCPHFFDDSAENPCEHCRGKIVVIDLSKIPEGFHDVNGDKICGDLDTMGWSVFCSRLITRNAELKIRAICACSRT